MSRCTRFALVTVQARARVWIDIGTYYAQLDPERFQVPQSFEARWQAPPPTTLSGV
jgi:hypothetical protein